MALSFQSGPWIEDRRQFNHEIHEKHEKEKMFTDNRENL